MSTIIIILIVLMALTLISLFYWVIRDIINNNKKNQQPVPSKGNESVTLPLQLQAYERLVLFVERITPASLISRLNQAEFSAKDMHFAILQTIRTEYDHNISQQIYVSKASWEAVKSAKEQLINIINQVAANIPPDAGAKELNKKLLEYVMANEDELPTQMAQNVLNAEAKKLF